MGGMYLLIILIAGASFLVSARFKRKFKKYASVPVTSGLSGKEVAEKMLRDNGISDVQVVSTGGLLTDNYNPTNKTVNLSADVYNGRSVASAAVAAHECGHAVQHARAYAWLGLRSVLVPVVSVVGNVIPFVLIGGILLINIFPYLLFAGIIMFAATTLFSFVTLPVELDASRRALAWIRTTNIAMGEEQGMAKDALKWAAMTYVVAAISSLVTLLYYVSIFLGRRD